ncbi:MAG: LamG-like jellyroll fold domain-containing protein [Roseobacter sp.]
MTRTLLHLPLDQLHDPSQFDLGPLRRSVTVEGTPRAVVDDRLGAAVQFDDADALTATLSDLGTDAAQEVTISMWFAPRHLPDETVQIAQIGNPKTGGVALLLTTVSADEAGLSLHSDTTQSTPVPIPFDAWRSVVVERKNGMWQLLIDGTEAQKIKDTRNLSDTILRLGNVAGTRDAGRFDLAQLRVTDAALAPSALQNMLAQDQTPLGDFRDENPLHLRLLDPSGAPNIYIGVREPLTLELQNQGSTDLVLKHSGTSAARLRFYLPQGTIHADLLKPGRRRPAELRVEGTEWTSKVTLMPDVMITLTPQVEMTLKPGETRVIRFPRIHAEPGSGTRAVRTLLEYDAIAGNEAVSGTRAKLLNVINRTGRSDVPLQAVISSSDMIPVGGTTILQLRVTNISSRDIVFEDRGGAARFDEADEMPAVPSSTLTVVLPRDVSNTAASPDAVLAANGAPLLPKIDGWQVEMRVDLPWACWLRISPTGGDRVLEGGASLEVTLADMPVSQISGPGAIRVIHSHLPDFAYGEAELPLRKATLSYDDASVHAEGSLTISGAQTQPATAFFKSGKTETGAARNCILSFHPGDAPSSIVQVNDHEFNVITNLDNMHIGTPGTGYLFHKDGYFQLGRDERITWTKDQVTIGPQLTVTGDVTITGDLTAQNKHFAIPHPHDPDAKLVHAVIESPESAVSYRGTGQLQNGTAQIELPHYFKDLTQEGTATVHLTAKGRIPFLLSADEVIGNHVRVFGTQADGTFAWEVRATRIGASFDVEPPPGHGHST